MADAEQQVRAYDTDLNKKYPELRLKSYVVAALGFERLCWRETDVQDV